MNTIYWHMNIRGANLPPGANLHPGANYVLEHGFKHRMSYNSVFLSAM